MPRPTEEWKKGNTYNSAFKTIILLLYGYVYIQYMTMISYHGSYIAHRCDYKAIALCCIY
jgi:hypothetical protein